MSASAIAEHPRQPLLNDAVVALRAPTQVWSATSGDLGRAPIHGVYHGDMRQSGRSRSPTAGSRRSGSPSSPRDGRPRRLRRAPACPRRPAARSEGAPAARSSRRRRHRQETLTITSHLADPIRTDAAACDWSPTSRRCRRSRRGSPLPRVEASRDAGRRPVDGGVGRALVHPRRTRAAISTVDGGAVTLDVAAARRPGRVRRALVVDRAATIPRSSCAARTVAHEWRRSADRRRPAPAALAGRRARRPRRAPAHPARPPGGRVLRRRRALVLHAVRPRLAVGGAARASGRRRDSRHPPCASSRGCRATASTRRPPSSPARSRTSCAAQPLALPGRGCAAAAAVLRHRRRDAAVGVPARRRVRRRHARGEVRALLPALRARAGLDDASTATARGHGFIDYIDETGHGLANQGWKDSGDSIQWRDGALARGTDRAVRGAGLRVRGRHRAAPTARRARRVGRRRTAGVGGNAARAVPRRRTGSRRPRAATRRSRSTRDQRPVDTLTSNIGHLHRHRHPRSGGGSRRSRAPARRTRCLGLRHPHDVDRGRRATGR